MLKKTSQFSQEEIIDTDYFIFCLEAVHDIETDELSRTQEKLEQLTMQYGIDSVYKTCDTIEGLESSLNALVLDNHNFKNYGINI